MYTANTWASKNPGSEWSVDRGKTGEPGEGCPAVIKTKLKKPKDACYSVFSEQCVQAAMKEALLAFTL